MSEIRPLRDSLAEELVQPASVQRTAIEAQEGSQMRPYAGEMDSPINREVAGLAASIDQDNKRDPGIDYSVGAPGSARWGFSRMDTKGERENWLNKNVGKGQWSYDSFGALILSSDGAKALGVETANPIAFDEQKGTWRDVADWGGDIPAIAGAAVGGTVAGGPWTGMALAGLTAMGGKGIDESVEAFQGYNQQSPTEVGSDLASDGALAIVGEGVGRTLKPVGSWLLGPNRAKMQANPMRRQVQGEAEEMGVNLGAGQLSGGRLLTYAEGMFKTLFGDINERANAEALHAQIRRLKTVAGRKMLRTDLGELIKANVHEAANTFRQRAGLLYARVDDLTGGEAFIPTAPLKARAAQILDDLAKTETKVVKGPIPVKATSRGPGIKRPGERSVTTSGGKPLFTAREIVQDLREVAELPEFMTTKDLQSIRSVLFNQYYEPTLAPGLTSHQARQLHKAAGESLESARSANPEIMEALDEAKNYYKTNIDKFDDHLISRITMDPGRAGSIDPELILDRVWRKGNPTKLNRLMRVLPDHVKEPLRREAMDDLTVQVIRHEDVFTEVFDGDKLLRTLDGYGKESLDAMFGAGTRIELYKLGRVASASMIKKSSGLVAAAIALHPVKNLGKLARLKLTQRVLGSKLGRKYLTQGYEVKELRLAVEAINRAFWIGSFIGEDETGSRYPDTEALPLGASKQRPGLAADFAAHKPVGNPFSPEPEFRGF